MGTTLRVFVAGAFGAIAPNLVGMGQQALAGAPDPEVGYLYARIGFWVGTLVFGVLGAGIAYFYKETSTRRAIALGAAAPALILGWAQGSAAKPSSHPAGHSAIGPIVTTAYAAEPTARVAFEQRESLWVVVTRPAATDAVADLVAVFAPHSTGPERMIFHLPAVSRPILVPGRPTEAYVLVNDVPSNHVSLSNVRGDTVKLELALSDQSFLSGFQRAFGIRSVSSRQPVIRITP